MNEHIKTYCRLISELDRDQLWRVQKLTKEVRALDGSFYFLGTAESIPTCNLHAATWSQTLKVKAHSLTDPTLITSLANEFGYDSCYEMMVSRYLRKSDLLFSINPTGKTKSIVRATAAAKEKGAFVVTLSGMDEHNPLQLLGTENIHIPSNNISHLQLIHGFILQTILDFTT